MLITVVSRRPFVPYLFSLPFPSVLEQKRSHDTSSNTNTTENSHAHQSLLGDLVINQLSQIRGLQVRRLLIEKKVVVTTSLAVVAELVVPQGEIVEAFATTFGREAEYIAEETDAELLVVAVV